MRSVALVALAAAPRASGASRGGGSARRGGRGAARRGGGGRGDPQKRAGRGGGGKKAGGGGRGSSRGSAREGAAGAPSSPASSASRAAPADRPSSRRSSFDLASFDDLCVATDAFPREGDREATIEEQLAFERKGHACVRGVLTHEEAAGMVSVLIRETNARTLEAYRHRVEVLCPRVDLASIRSVDDARNALAAESEEDVGFLQTFNLHRDAEDVQDPECVSGAECLSGASGSKSSPGSSSSPAPSLPSRDSNPEDPHRRSAASYILSRRLATVAASLLGADSSRGDRVRVYQSCVFVKPPGFGETHWHSDANMVPLDTNAFVTLWLPLRPLAEDDAALVFASGSHRDFALPYWKTLEGMADLSARGYEVEAYEPLDLGDLTAHHGWCLHWSPPQPSDCPPRHALSVCYFLDGARRLEREKCRQDPHTEDAWSYDDWIGDVREGDVARHPALPVVFE